MKNRTVKLVAIPSSTKDDDGFETPGTPIEKTVFADVKSVGWGEYYEGLRDGIKASMIFKLNMGEYIVTKTIGSITETYRPTKIKFDGAEYKIVREYKRGYGFLEVTGEEIL